MRTIITSLLLALLSLPALAGDGTISNPDLADNASVALSKLELIQNNSVVGNASGGVANPQQLNSEQLTSILNAFTGDSGSGGVKGAVPAPSSGDTGLGKFLHADGSWSVPGAPPADSVSNSALANMVQATVKGRASGAGTGDPTDLSATQVTAIIEAFTGDSGSGGVKGAVPAPSSGDTGLGKFLHASGGWSTPTVAASYTLNRSVAVGGNGRGTVGGDKIRRFDTITNTGSCIVGADDAGNGATFTIQTGCADTYTITYCDYDGTGSNQLGVTVNASSLSSSVTSYEYSTGLRCVARIHGSGGQECCTTKDYFNVGDVIRAHTSGTMSGTNATDTTFIMVKDH